MKCFFWIIQPIIHYSFGLFKLTVRQNKKGRLCNNSKIETIISKQLSVENKAKLSQPTRADVVTIAKLTH